MTKKPAKKKVVPVVPEGVSNNKTPQSREIPKKYWIFTVPLFLEDFGSMVLDIFDFDKILENLNKSGASKYAFQLEQGDTGYLHWQIYMEHKSKTRFTTLQKIWTATHIEPTKSDSAFAYCTKEESRVGGPWIFPEPPYEYKGEDIIKELYPWQKNLKNYLTTKKPDPRKIIWIWDEKGNLGKTQFAKYMNWHHKAFICTSGKHNDIKHLISEYQPWSVQTPIFIFNLPRTYEDSESIYQLLEELKDGILVSGKYEGCMRQFGCPHIVIFANFEPKKEKLSLDRWAIKNLNEC